MQRRIPELLAPAGSPPMLETALEYGADAVYLGGPGPNLRAKGSRFSWQELERGFRLLRSRSKRGYLCLNAFPRGAELDAARETLEHVADLPQEAAPHGLIVADPGVLHLARHIAPHLPLHLSTQANSGNEAALAFWQDQGVQRVNLARELDIPAMRRLFHSQPVRQGLELEVFVHGAQCMAISGRCLLSAWLNQRSANMGACTHPCRYDYRPTNSLLLEERLRPGAPLLELQETGEYSEILAAEDLCLLPYLRWLRRAHAVKIEGRTKSEGHLAQVLDAYRAGLDTLAAAGRFDPRPLLEELQQTAKRPLTSGMFLPQGRRRTWLVPDVQRLRPLVARVLETEAPGCYRVAVRAPWPADAALELLQPGLRRPLLAPGSYGLEDEEGRLLQRAHPGVTVRLRCDMALKPGWFLRQGPASVP